MSQGQTISVKDGIKHDYKLKLQPTEIDKPWKTQIVMSTLPVDQLPKSLQGPGAKHVCAVESVLSSDDMKEKNRHWYNSGPKWYRAQFAMQVIIGAADLKFQIVGKDGVVSKSHNEVAVQWANVAPQVNTRPVQRESFAGPYRETPDSFGPNSPTRKTGVPVRYNY